jgi:dolichol-phosphate mannosyltransferase
VENLESRYVCVIIPVLNESKTIKGLIESIIKNSELSQTHIIIIDDGSTDGTLEIIQGFDKKYQNVSVIERGYKKGLGTAIRDGFNYALNLKPIPDLVVTMDGDLSHDPSQLRNLTKECKKNSIVVGSRYIKGGEISGWNIKRKTISWGANILTRILVNIPVKDATSGYRCYGVNALKEILPNLKSEGYEIQIEALSIAHRQGYKINEIPIIFRDRIEGKSKLKNKEIWSFIKKLNTLFKLSGEWKRMLKFCAVGISGIIINEAILWTLTEIYGFFYLYSSIISTESAILNNFVWNELWTFHDTHGDIKSGIIKRFLKFQISRFGGLILGSIFLILLTEILSVYYLISNIFSILIVMMYNYITSKEWVWASRTFTL